MVEVKVVYWVIAILGGVGVLTNLLIWNLSWTAGWNAACDDQEVADKRKVVRIKKRGA